MTGARIRLEHDLEALAGEPGSEDPHIIQREEGEYAFVETASVLGNGGGPSVGDSDLEDLNDVAPYSSLADGEVLQFDGPAGAWRHRTLTEAGISQVGHTHVEADITDLDHYGITDFNSDFAAKDTDDLSEGASNFYYTQARFDADFGLKDTGDLSEGTNLYFTDERAQDAVGAMAGVGLTYTDATPDLSVTLTPFDTGDLSEGTNLYWTQARFDSAFGLKDTGDLSEGTNLYFTDARAINAVEGAAGIDLSGTLDVTGAVTLDGDLKSETLIVEGGGTVGPFSSRALIVHTGNSFTVLDQDPDGSGIIIGVSGATSHYIQSQRSGAGSLRDLRFLRGVTEIARLASDKFLVQQGLESVGAATLDTGATGSSFGGDLTVSGVIAASTDVTVGGVSVSLVGHTHTETDITDLVHYTSSDFDTDFGGKSTTDLSEGTNLYWTATRFDNAFAAKDTDDLSEGAANLYHTSERVDDRVAALLVGGTDIGLTYDDGAGTLTIDFTGSAGGATQLDGLSDVTLSAVADNEVLQFDNASGVWINRTLSEAGIAATGHTHAAGDITSGTLADARLSSNVALLDTLQTFTNQNNFEGSSTTAAAIEIQVSGDGERRLLFRADGGIFFGDGTNPVDASILRSGTGALTLNDDVTASGDLTVAGNLTVNGVGHHTFTGRVSIEADSVGVIGLSVKRHTASGRAQMALLDEGGSELWRFGTTGGGVTTFNFFGGASDVLVLAQGGDVTIPTGDLIVGTDPGGFQLARIGGRLRTDDGAIIQEGASSTVLLVENSAGGDLLRVENTGNLYVDGIIEANQHVDLKNDQRVRSGTSSFLGLNEDNLTRSGTNQVLLASTNEAIFAIDTSNNQTVSEFVWGHNSADPGDGNWEELMRLTEDGDLTILGSLAWGGGSPIASSDNLLSGDNVAVGDRTQGAIFSSDNAFSVAASGTEILGSQLNWFGIVVLIDQIDDAVGLYLVDGTSVTLLHSSGTTFSANGSADNDLSIDVSDGLVLTNNGGSITDYTIINLGGSPA